MIRSFRLLLLTFALFTASSSQTKELRVPFGAPQGATSSIDQSFRIVAGFSEPMAPLTAAPEGAGSGPLEITPRVKGRYRWLGTTTLSFTPDDTLPYATRFTVTIPAGTRSLSGAKLSQPFTWMFETPQPSVVRTSPASGEQRVDPSRVIVVEFNQPVDPATVGAWISLEERPAAGGLTYSSYRLRRPTDDELSVNFFRTPGRDAQRARSAKERERIERERECTIVIVPASPFLKKSAVRVVFKAGLQGKQGALGMEHEFVEGFSIYGSLRFLSVASDNNFNPASPLRFTFTNPVSGRDLASHITVAPQTPVKPSYMEDYSSDQQYITFDLKPETDYSGTIAKGLKDIFGNQLESDAPFSFRTQSYPSSIRMTSGPGLVEAYEEHKIPVVFMNADSAGLLMARVPADEIVPIASRTNFYENNEWSAAELARVPKADRIERIWKMSNPRNKAVMQPVALDEILGASHKGIALIQLKKFGATEEESRIMRSIVQVTEMGVTAKFSPDSILVWVTQLKDVSPIEGADIEIRTDSNRVVWRGRTGAHGLAMAPGWGKLGVEPRRQTYGEEDEYESVQTPRLWVIVNKDGDCAFTSSEWNEGIQPFAFDIYTDWNPQPEAFEGSLFTDRGLYKASETVNVKGIVRSRKEGAWHVAPQAPVRITVNDPRNEELLKRTLTLNEFGSFSLAIPMKPSVPTGYYRMRLEVRRAGAGAKERWMQIAAGEFRVEAFRVAEFDVRSQCDRDAYTVGDTVRGFLSARYLFGAPLKNAPVRWRFTLSKTEFTPKGYEAYSFGRLDWLSEYSEPSASRTIASGDSVLDEFGAIKVMCVLAQSEAKGTSSLMLEGDATSVSRQTLSGRTSVIVHGGEYYVGVKPSTTFLPADSALDVSLVTVTKDGVPVAGRDVTVKLFRRVWHSVRKAETGGRYAWQTEVVDSLIDSSRVRLSKEAFSKRFTPAVAGLYYIDASSVDERGNVIETEATFYVSGSGYVAWERRDDDRIDLVADHANYKPGDNAEILVKNPYERATALVSIEREGIISHYTTVLEGSAPRISVPIEHAYLPNVFVSVVLLEGRIAVPAESQESDVGRPSFKVGYVMLSVSPKEKQLSVSVEASRKDYHPGDTVSAVISVRNDRGAGVKSELTVSAADLGVLNLIGYHLPDPFDAFYRERGLAVTTTETRLHLVSQRNYGEKGEDMGGGGASLKAAAELDAEGMRKDFRASAYWNPSLVTDDSGRVTVRFKLPDNITAFKLMAVAQSMGSEFGEGETSFSVSKPLLLQPSLPRLARVGDEFDAGVVAVNYTSEARRVKLTANAAGIALRAKDTVSIELAPGQAREVTYHFTAEKIGTAAVSVKAESGEEKDGLRWTFPVVAPRAKETTALFNSLSDARREEKILIPQSVVPDEGSVEVSASSTALVGLSGAVNYLFTYPYGCLEQRASSVLPIILANDLVDAFKLEVFKNRDAKQVAQKTIDELPLFQKYNGGFSYWKSDQAPFPYISAYAVITLLEAKAHGYKVDAGALNRGIEYLRRIISGEEQYAPYSYELGACTRAIMLYALARAGQPDFGAMDKLFSERAGMPLFAKAYLMRASAISNRNAAIVTELARDLANRAKVDPTGASFEEPNESGLAWIFHSNTRTTAVILQALIESGKETELEAKIVRRLLNTQRNGRWRTTQENIYVVAALAAYFKKYESEVPKFRATIAVAGKALLEAMFAGRSMETKKESEAISDLPKGKTIPVGITKDGAGRLYYGIRLNYTPKGETVPRSEGITLLRSMEPAEGGDATNIRAGALMKVTVTVIAYQDRHYVAVDDPMPAGFEVVATTFATSASNLQEERESGAFNHIERYDDRVSLFADYLPVGIHSYTYLVRAIHAGVYQLPGTHVECMYEPEIFGATASGTVTVR